MIYLYPIDHYACGSYRMLWPLGAVLDQHPEMADRFKVVVPGSDGGIKARIMGGRVSAVTIPDDVEAVVIQRPSSIAMAQCIPILQHNGVKVIIELDDDLCALTPRHPTWHILRKPGHDARVLVEAAKHANLVTATTPALLERYAPHGRAKLLPNRIPRHLFQRAEETERTPTDPPRVGWPGAVKTHPDDLPCMGNALAQTRIGQFTIVGGGNMDMIVRQVGMPRDRINLVGDIAFDDWIPALVRELDVAVVPLQLSAFNHAKSALKALELSVAGVPFIASPTVENLALGAGLFVADNKPKRWAQSLRTLLGSADLRESERERNLGIALTHVLEDYADAWLEAWT